MSLVQSVRIVVMVSVGILTLGSSGCSGGPGEEFVFERERTLGSWVELLPTDPEFKPSPRRPAPPPAPRVLRKLTINDDNTFVMEVVDRKSNASVGTVEGTWAIEKDTMHFEVTSNTLPAEHQDLAPVQTGGWHRRYTEAGTSDALTLVDLRGEGGEFKRP